MDELIYSVREVFSSFLLKEQAGYYNIPEYQRGYKWNEANIVALLNDIEKFRQETRKRRSYILLPAKHYPGKKYKRKLFPCRRRATTPDHITDPALFSTT